MESNVTLVQLVQTQMKCFDKLYNLFDDIDSKMCEANNATSDNDNCWNGKEFGRYCVYRDILSIFVLINLAAADPTQTSIANFKCLLLHSNLM